MNILILTQFFYPDTLGGGGRYPRLLAAGLVARSHRVTVLTPRVDDQPEEELTDGARVIRYPSLRGVYRLPQALVGIRRWVRRLHAERSIELMAVQQPLPALALAGDRVVAKIPWVYHFHSPWAVEAGLQREARRWDPSWWAGLWVRRFLEHSALQRSRRQVVLSDYMRSLLTASHPALATSVRVVPGCVDLSRFQPTPSMCEARRRLGVPEDRPLLFTVRHLLPRQNLDGLIRAMSTVAHDRQDVLLVIGGTGPLAGQLQALVRALRLEAQVRLLGAVSDVDLPVWYQAAELFIMPSKALEGFGLATIEALACGTPVVGTPVGGTQELLRGADVAVLCEGTEADALARGILLGLDRFGRPERRRELANRCWAFASHYSSQRMATSIEEVYREAAMPRVD